MLASEECRALAPPYRPAAELENAAMSKSDKSTRSDRIRLANVIEHRAECRVSNRWLHFNSIAQENPDGSGGCEQLVFANVMTQNADGVAHKICELVLDRQELLDLLNRMPVYPPRKK